MATSGADPIVVPKVVKFGFKDFHLTTTKRSATCKAHGAEITDGPRTTSNFVHYLKTHPDR
jgi:hypothetical protein